MVFGIILLSVGAVASLYPDVKTLDTPYGQSIEISRTYPFQNLGIILVVAGITISAIGLILSKTSPLEKTNNAFPFRCQ